jgi:hypothetical protein
LAQFGIQFANPHPFKHISGMDTARIVALATRQVVRKNLSDAEKGRRSEAASILGNLGVSKGGKPRAANPSADQRSEIAKKAAIARWSKA